MTCVLIVDDEDMIREELHEALEFEEFDVSTASSAIEALKICSQAAFDVIVTDLKMPKMGGLDLIRKLKERGNQAIVFVVSGHGAETNKTEAMDLGAAACFNKPLDIDELILAISEHHPS